MTVLDSFIRFFVPGTLIVATQDSTIRSFLVVDRIAANKTLILLRDDSKSIRSHYQNMLAWFQQYGKDMQVYSPEGIEQDMSMFDWEYVERSRFEQSIPR